MLNDVLLFAVALVPLTLGADWLVRGAAGLAQRLGVSPLVIGLTVVAFGTSLPELVVSGKASLAGDPGIAVGNIMGSTAANVGLIVGLGALIRPIAVHRRLIVRETPLIIIVLSLVVGFSLDDSIGRLDGLMLVVGWLGYMLFLIKLERAESRTAARSSKGRNQTPEDMPVPEAKRRLAASGKVGEPTSGAAEAPSADNSEDPRLWLSLVRVGVGLPAIMYGADWLLTGATGIATDLNVPKTFISATVIAVGTSLPELASTLAAAYRRLSDIALGNIIGSNVFNLGLVLGTAAGLRPLVLDPTVVVDYILPALVFSVLLIPLAVRKARIGRVEGALLLVLYIAYFIWLIGRLPD